MIWPMPRAPRTDRIRKNYAERLLKIGEIYPSLGRGFLPKQLVPIGVGSVSLSFSALVYFQSETVPNLGRGMEPRRSGTPVGQTNVDTNGGAIYNYNGVEL